MNSMERFVSLMQGKLPDRVPVICNLLDQGAKELNMSIEEYYSKGENVAEGQIIWIRHSVGNFLYRIFSKNTWFKKNDFFRNWTTKCR